MQHRRFFGQEGFPMTMAISSATTTPVQWQTGTTPSPPPDFGKNMQSVADLFGMSTDDLKSQLQSGKSLADIAQSKGVSRDTLVSTLEKSMQANAPANAPAGFASQLDNIVNHMVDHKGMGGPGGMGGVGGGHHHHGARQATDVSNVDFQSNTDSLLSTIANQLNVSPSDLVSQMESGMSLTDISTQAGTDPTQLFQSIGTGNAVNLLS
jgi:lambda repressor-like predicted transcriptional regulator